MGDSRGDEDGINKNVLNNLLEQAKAANVEFVVFVGDLITGSKHREIHKRRLVKWKDLTEEYGIPVYIALGNHEITSETSEDIFRSLFEMPDNGPASFKELAYSFDYKNSHFVILDTNLYNNFHRLGAPQLEWLKNDLAVNKKDIIFVFGHEPAYPVAHHLRESLDLFPSERDELWKIFHNSGVSVYFCGHEHLYNKSIHGKVYQLITGGAGAKLRTTVEQGGFYHFVIVDVMDNGDFEITVKDIKGKIRDNFMVWNFKKQNSNH
ncbi:MAG: metallophosphoesterase [Candidatus Omnitrophota bacterium]